MNESLPVEFTIVDADNILNYFMWMIAIEKDIN